jgi:hypothetical protein
VDRDEPGRIIDVAHEVRKPGRAARQKEEE